MARAVYIVCAESMSLDKSTNLISLFHVLEGYTISPPPVGGKLELRGEGYIPLVPSMHFDFVGVAVWARDENDPIGAEYEARVEVKFPWEDSPREVTNGNVKFVKVNQRFTARVVMQLTQIPQSSGDIAFVSYVRRVGSTEWQSQEYRLPITISSTPYNLESQ